MLSNTIWAWTSAWAITSWAGATAGPRAGAGATTLGSGFNRGGAEAGRTAAGGARADGIGVVLVFWMYGCESVGIGGLSTVGSISRSCTFFFFERDQTGPVLFVGELLSGAALWARLIVSNHVHI
jgi:hypothetical protein